MARWESMLESVVHERRSRLVAYAMVLTGSRPDAEDLVQDALVATFSGRARFATVPEAEAYVRRAVVSRYVDTGRRRTSERRALSRVGGYAAADSAAPPTAGLGLAPEVEAALAGLSPRERACVVLRHMEDLSVRETAHLLRLSEGAVKRYVSDGVRTLAAVLGATAGEHVPVVQTSPTTPVRRGQNRKEVRSA